VKRVCTGSQIPRVQQSHFRGGRWEGEKQVRNTHRWQGTFWDSEGLDIKSLDRPTASAEAWLKLFCWLGGGGGWHVIAGPSMHGRQQYS
jgi:hypothetical protein